MDIIKSTFILCVAILFTSCSVSKHLSEDARVHVKTNIEFANPELIKNKKEVKNDLVSISQPEPATGFSKWQTNLYNKLSTKVKRDSTGREKGVRGWVIRSIGKPPVYFDVRMINRSRSLFQKYFNDNGYFGTTIQVDSTLDKKEVTINYNIFPKEQYFVRNIQMPNDSIEFIKKIMSFGEKSLLISGTPYDQTKLTAERERLTKLANNSGYLSVNKDHFYFFVDTALGTKHVDVFMQVRQPADSTIFKAYSLNHTVVFASHNLPSKESERDTTIIDNFEILQKKKVIRPKVLANIINGEKGQLYSAKQQDDAITRLLDLGIYKFVNLQVEKEITDSAYLYNRKYFLSPGLMQDVTAEFEAISRSTSYFGLASTVTYSHKNIFRGAERLDVSVSGGIGTQNNTTEDLLNTLDGAFQISLTLPRLLFPFNLKLKQGPFIPKTVISIGDDYQQRKIYYTVNTFTFQYGFRWSKAKNKHHQLVPLNINQFIVKEVTDSMKVLLEENPRLKNSFKDVFILGLYYNYTYSSQTTNLKKPYFYFRPSFETSGNVANLLISTINKQQEKPYTIFGAPFAQFIRLDSDFRYYIPLNKAFIATRFIAGVGIAYGNSEVLPYIKQYFIGGPSSIRAFQFRALGPGSVVPPDKNENSFIEQTGDMRLEANVEYRFPMISYLKGAVFVDAGNIWLLDNSSSTSEPLVEGVFNFDTFYKQIAVGTGFGFRLDLSVLVIRLDMAFPLRKPWLEEGGRWVIRDIRFLERDWRNNNIQWNFAIGYPF